MAPAVFSARGTSRDGLLPVCSLPLAQLCNVLIVFVGSGGKLGFAGVEIHCAEVQPVTRFGVQRSRNSRQDC